MPNTLVLINTIKEVLISHAVHLDMGLFSHYCFSARAQTWAPFLKDFRDSRDTWGCFYRSSGVTFYWTAEVGWRTPTWLGELSYDTHWESYPETDKPDTQPILGIWLGWLYGENEEFVFGVWLGVPMAFPAQGWEKLETPTLAAETQAEAFARGADKTVWSLLHFEAVQTALARIDKLFCWGKHLLMGSLQNLFLYCNWKVAISGWWLLKDMPLQG